jgi:hypothetical protein
LEEPGKDAGESGVLVAQVEEGIRFVLRREDVEGGLRGSVWNSDIARAMYQLVGAMVVVIRVDEERVAKRTETACSHPSPWRCSNAVK